MRLKYSSPRCFLNEGKRGESCLGFAREMERAAALSVGASSSIHGSHFVFFPVLPNMELQSCSLPHLS